MRSLVILASLLILVAPFVGQQIPTQNLKVDVDLVLVNATVTDPQDRYVVGLSKDNFRVWEKTRSNNRWNTFQRKTLRSALD